MVGQGGDPMADLKRQAAAEAAHMVQDGMVVGLGSGTTSAFMIEELGRRWSEGLRFAGIPTSEKSAERARAHGIRLVTFADCKELDLAIDGADEVQRGSLSLIKGLGGALFREKIVADAARRLVIVVDESKLVDTLGSRSVVPVEVTCFGWQRTAWRLERLGARVSRRMDRDGSVYITDGGNMILDCGFTLPDGRPGIADGHVLARAIRDVVGVIESGLFINRTSEVIVAGRQGLTRLEAQ